MASPLLSQLLRELDIPADWTTVRLCPLITDVPDPRPGTVKEACETCGTAVWYSLPDAGPGPERLLCKFCTGIYVALAELTGWSVVITP